MVKNEQFDFEPTPVADVDFPEIDTIPTNPDHGRQAIQIISPEFVSNCPRNAWPDFATVILRYVPHAKLLELKSFKMYINSFFGVAVHHEEANRLIAEKLAETLQPRWLSVTMDWKARGGVKTRTCRVWSPRAEDNKPGYMVYPDTWQQNGFDDEAKNWNNQ